MSEPIVSSFPERLGRYTVQRKLSEGGMAEIFLANRSVAGFDKRVVIKRILPAHAEDPSFAAMLANEARIVTSLCHPNVVHVEDVLEVEGGPYIVMEYLPGVNLREILQRASEQKRRLSPGVACRIVADVLAGLAYAHDHADGEGKPLGLVHRDVTLSNVVVTWSGCVKLIDFGIAKATEQLGGPSTQAGHIKGKMSYLSPEQIRGRALDRRTDLFSLGVILWEMLTRKRLYARETDLETLRAIAEHDAPPPSTVAPELPAKLDRICKKALARDRDQRYRNAERMRADLEKLILAQGWPATTLDVQRELASLFPELAPKVVEGSPLDSLDGLTQSAATAAEAEPVIVVEEAVEAAPLRPRRSREVELMNRPTPGPSVYDDWKSGPARTRGRTRMALWLALLGCLFFGVVETAARHLGTAALAASEVAAAPALSTSARLP